MSEQNTPLAMPQYVIDRVIQKRGKVRVFDSFDPARTALVVIDMQRFYVDGLAQAKQIIPTINRLAAQTRARGGTVAWVRMTSGLKGTSLWPLYHDFFCTPEQGAQHRDQLSAGSPGHELHPDLDVRPEDLHASKSRFSAFLPHCCDLHAQLQQRGLTNVAICGTVTNHCCETSARDAMMMDYQVAMISDANAARFEQDHIYGMTTVLQNFGDVVTADEFLNSMLGS
jgi:nicotinamidase-related amidase